MDFCAHKFTVLEQEEGETNAMVNPNPEVPV